MKEFALKHPFITFFIADGIVTGVVKIVAMLTGYAKKPDEQTTETNEEEPNNEPAGDIQ